MVPSTRGRGTHPGSALLATSFASQRVLAGPRGEVVRRMSHPRETKILCRSHLVYASLLMTKADLYRLVDDLPEDAVEDTAVLLKRITLRQLDPAQAWVWTEHWQEQLRGSFADLEAGRTQHFDTAEEFMAAL